MEFYRNVLAAVKREYGVDFSYEACTSWDRNELKECTLFGEGRSWWDWLHDRSWLWAQFPAVEGAIGGIAQLRQQGHYVEAVTSKPDWARWTVWSWLGKWRPDFHQVTIVSPGQRKVDFTKADLLVDDNLDNCYGFAEQFGRGAIVFDRPWNKISLDDTLTGQPPLWRAYNWQDVLRLVEEIASE